MLNQRRKGKERVKKREKELEKGEWVGGGERGGEGREGGERGGGEPGEGGGCWIGEEEVELFEKIKNQYFHYFTLCQDRGLDVGDVRGGGGGEGEKEGEGGVGGMCLFWAAVMWNNLGCIQWMREKVEEGKRRTTTNNNHKNHQGFASVYSSVPLPARKSGYFSRAKGLIGRAPRYFSSCLEQNEKKSLFFEN